MSETPTRGEAAAAGLRVELAEPGGVERWWLDNPARRNAVTPAALHWMAARCEALRGQVVVLAGSGPQFCAGFDLTALGAAIAADAEALAPLPDQPLIDATEAMRRADATFVAGIARYAIGAGVELIASCDFRIFSAQTWLEVPAGKLGVVYHAGGLRRIAAAFGPQVARRLVLAADRVPCEELDRAHAVSRIVPAESLEAELRAFANQLAALDPAATRNNRRLLRALDLPKMPTELLAGHESARALAYGRAYDGAKKSRDGDAS